MLAPREALKYFNMHTKQNKKTGWTTVYRHDEVVGYVYLGNFSFTMRGCDYRDEVLNFVKNGCKQPENASTVKIDAIQTALIFP